MAASKPTFQPSMKLDFIIYYEVTIRDLNYSLGSFHLVMRAFPAPPIDFIYLHHFKFEIIFVNFLTRI